jgi:hypothetical protein
VIFSLNEIKIDAMISSICKTREVLLRLLKSKGHELLSPSIQGNVVEVSQRPTHCEVSICLQTEDIQH